MRKKRAISPEGIITREGSAFVVRIPWQDRHETLPGVRREEYAPTGQVVARKDFVVKQEIFLPEQEELANRTILGGQDVLIVGMNGLSSLTPERLKAWHIEPGRYEAACADLLETIVKALQSRFEGLRVKLVHGASDMGVDKAIIHIARKLRVDNLGFSCPKFMLYVKDTDDIPVYVAATQEDYSKAFVKALHILITANGGKQTFLHDIQAAFDYFKHVVPIDVLGTIAPWGKGVAIGPNQELQDAVGLLNLLLHTNAEPKSAVQSERWASLQNFLVRETTGICMDRLSPSRAFVNGQAMTSATA